MRTPPLFTGKCWIGNNYQRPLPNLVQSKDALLIQYALLSKEPPSLLNYIRRLFGL